MELNETELKFLYLGFDLIVLNIAILMLYSISPLLIELKIPDKSYFPFLLNMSYAITYSLFSAGNIYFHDNFSNRVKRITSRVSIFIILSLILENLFLPTGFSYRFLALCVVFFYCGELIFYYILYSYLKYRRAKGFYVHRVLIVGLNNLSIKLSQQLTDNPMLGYEFIGFVSENPIENVNILGHVDELGPLVSHHQVDFIFVTLSDYFDANRSRELLATCNRIGIRLRFVPENQSWFKNCSNIETIGSLAIFNPQKIPLDDLKSRFAKRIFDIVFSSMVIVFVISWLFPLMSLVIKLTSKGPVFFKQKRTGINNRTFTCLKFRSMRMNNDADSKQATRSDNRVTPIGRFLRATNIDEFPQFFNVLFGQMSIVGPRPHMLKHTDQYSELIEFYRVRHYVKPGITGWAQVNGYRGETDELWKMEKRVEYDIHYLENWHFSWDLKIILKTVVGKSAHKNAF